MAKIKNPQTEKGNQSVEAVESTLTKAENFIESNRKVLSWILTGIIVIILAIFGYNKLILQPKIEAANEQMFMAEYYFSVDSLDLALNGDGNNLGFYDIIDEYGRTPAGRLSHYYVGLILMKQGQFEDAIDHLKKFKSKDEILSAMAKGAIGDAYVELGDLDEALEYYLEAANKRPNYFVTPIFLSKAAWVYEEQGELQKALDIYVQIKTEYFRSFEGREADKYIAYLEAKLNME